MFDRPHNDIAELTCAQAAEWLICIHAGKLSSSDRLKYVRWLKRSPVHVRAMLELSLLAAELRSSDLRATTTTHRQRDPMVVVDLGLRRGNAEAAFAKPRWRSWRHWKFAASACLSRVGHARRALSRLVRPAQADP